jgi:urease accessory protein
MLRAIGVAKPGEWPDAEARGTVTLTFHDRHRRRIRLVTDKGEAFILDLPQTARLAEGDGLRLAEGGWIRVCAADEALLEVTAASPADLARLAWHLGNRHLPVEFAEGRLRIRDDHVIGAMLDGLGAALRRLRAPFEPEGGAYGGGHAHDHDRDDHDH